MKNYLTLYAPSRFIFPLMLAICLGCSLPSATQETYREGHADRSASLLDQILETGVIRVGTTGDYLPYSYHLGTGPEYHGIDIELAKDLAKSLGVQVEFVKTSWPTLLEDLKAQRFDIGMCGITVTLARQKQALFSLPFSPGGKVGIARDEHVEKYPSIEAINQQGVRVIVNPGGTNEIFAKEHFPMATIILHEDNLGIFQQLVDGEADIMVTDAIETRVQQIIHPELEAINPDKPFNFFEKGYLLPVDHTFKAYIDQWVNLRQKDGTYAKLFDAELENIQQHFSTQ